MIAIAALLLKIVGIGFLLIAAVGVIRLPDSFQRMHAATKAGTLGAGLVVLGTLVGQQSAEVTIIGSLTIMFLLLTVPVTGHLLGRAAYMSGTPLGRLTGGNALDGVLAREMQPLIERTATAGTVRRPPSAQAAKSVEFLAPEKSLAPLAAVRFALIRGEEERVFARAFAIAQQNGVPLTAHAIVDSRTIAGAEDRAEARARIRQACAAAMTDLGHQMRRAGAELSVCYDEGQPETILRDRSHGGTLLVAPQDGWFHHGVELLRCYMSWAPDGLLHLPAIHDGPVLYAGAPRPPEWSKIVVGDCGEGHLPNLVEWALQSGLWRAGVVCHQGGFDQDRIGTFERISDRAGFDFMHIGPPGIADGQKLLSEADATILGAMPRPLRARWYGTPWTERIASGFAGDVLVLEAER